MMAAANARARVEALWRWRFIGFSGKKFNQIGTKPTKTGKNLWKPKKGH
jgi:hypothetical protein